MPRSFPPLEKTIQAAILRHLNGLPDTWGVKFACVYGRGIPDLLVCHHGHFVALEVKRPGERATPIQRAQLERIEKAGGIAEVVRSVEDVKRVLKEVGGHDSAN